MRKTCLIAVLLAAAAVLPGCASTPGTESAPTAVAATPSAASAAPAEEPPAKPMDVHTASAQCWMKYDKSGGSLDAKSKLVDKCIDDTMKAAKR